MMEKFKKCLGTTVVLALIFIWLASILYFGFILVMFVFDFWK